ncbi:uncharacterized protein [Typha angustifolia]|uniref:uncharacterized protein n=1 Tax=Typha angustifolia TaxID=59011 RepID=UPI003C2E213D
MIQELLTGMVDENKISIPLNNHLLIDHPSNTTTSSSSSSSSAHSKVSAASSEEPLRCPRCDSSNTKFCYYNNYNLTQPRHFCKTCRRYWTKGGALRNVPIGGGCRKARAIPSIAAKAKPASNDASASPNTAQLMALLRATQNPNPNPSHNLENLGQLQVGLGSSLWRSHGQYTCQQLQPLQRSSMLLGEVPSLGIKWPGNYHNDQLQAVISSMAGFNNSSSSSSACAVTTSTNASTAMGMGAKMERNATSAAAAAAGSILEQIPLGGGDQFGNYWNSGLSWSDLNSANGAFP